LDFSPDGTLYASAGDLLSVINPATAAASNLLTLTNAAAGATTAGAALCFGREGTLYVSDGYSLYKVNPANGQCAEIAPFHTNSSGARLTIPIYGLATAPDGTLFGGDRDLYTIDPATATATWIGAICAYPGFIQGRDMAFGSDGNLYLIGMDVFGDTALYDINTNNAALTRLGAFPGPAFGLVQSNNPAVLAITAQPAAQSVPAGGTATFSVTATGQPAPVPQWYFDGQPFAGGTDIILTISNVAAINAGGYSVVLTNASGAVTSEVVTLAVTPDFTFLATAAIMGGGAGGIVSLSTNPPAETVLGSNNTLLTCLGFDTNAVLYAANNTLYRVTTNSDPWGLVTVGPILQAGSSAPLTLTGMAFSPSNVLYGVAGNQLFTIDATMARATLVTGYPSNLYISAVAFGPDGRMYGGELDLYRMDPATGHLISDLGPLAGPDGEILGDMKFGSDGYLYFCGGLNGNVYRLDPMTARTSLVAATPFNLSGLAFYPAPFDTTRPSITLQPASQVGALGGRVTFSAAVAGAGPMTYQWSNGAVRLQDGSRISGAASPSLTIANLMQSDAGTYVMTVSNAFGSAATFPATLAIGAGPAITVQPAAATSVVEGSLVTLSVTAAGAAPLLYQWMAGGSIIPGATSRTLAVSAAPLDGVTAPFYTVLVRNGFGVSFSASAEVIVLPNLTKPGVTIAVPAANARTASNAISGAASANATRVFYWTTNINNGVVTVSPPDSAALAPSPSGVAWSAVPTLLPGSNVLVVQAQNQYGNSSTRVSRPFFYKVAAPLALTIAADTGAGTLAGRASVPGDTVPGADAMLNIGEGYSITAQPGAHCLFSNWSGTLGQIATPTIHFVMESNMSLQADFITNLFIGMAGRYDGIFQPADSQGASEATSGLIENLLLKTNGLYSGKIYLAGATYSLNGSFDAWGQATETITRTAAAGGKVLLELNVASQSVPREITGMVQGTTQYVGGWISTNLALYAATTNTNNFHAYAVLLPQDTNVAGAPPSYGYALITNTGSTINLGGKLSDGTPFSRSEPINEQDEFPVYANLYKSPGLLLGQLSLDAAAAPAGTLSWIKPEQKTGLYSNGFDAELVVEGSPWTNSTVVLANLFPTNAQLIFSGGGLASNLVWTVQLTSSNVLRMVSGATNFISGTINRTNGLLTLSYRPTGVRTNATVFGTLLQNIGLGGGYFLLPGATNTGAITLKPARS
jgi:hypothetical protein